MSNQDNTPSDRVPNPKRPMPRTGKLVAKTMMWCRAQSLEGEARKRLLELDQTEFRRRIGISW